MLPKIQIPLQRKSLFGLNNSFFKQINGQKTLFSSLKTRSFTNSSKSSSSNMNKKHYAVLVAGDPPAEITKYGDYGDMLIKLLKDNSNEQWDKYRCVDGEFPNNEEIKKYSGFVVSGSRYDAHGKEAWIAKLKALCRNIVDNKQSKLLGICFGHQVISIALNGMSGRSNCGWELGTRIVEFNQHFQNKFPYFKNLQSLSVHQIHQDQVSKLPPKAILLASSKKTPIEMYIIDDNVLCVQGHPEFEENYVRDLINIRQQKGIYTNEVAQQALQSIDHAKSATLEWSKIIKLWFKTPLNNYNDKSKL